MEVGNWGWYWPRISPNSTVDDALAAGHLGSSLKDYLSDFGRRQLYLAFEFEQLPETSNCVRIDSDYRDALGNFRPVINYQVNDYTKRGIAEAWQLSKQIYATINAEDQTDPEREHGFDGPGHAAGTHVMGTTRNNSVTNTELRSWDHENLYIVGCGSMPTIGTSNPTLTGAALTTRAAEAIVAQMDRETGR